MSGIRYDKELEQYRNLMLPPDRFEEGFRWSSLVGALFIAFLMVPGAMYMQLVAGFGVGPAAQWVTVILFIEVARRAHKNLRRPELFVLFYMAGAVMQSPFAGLFWRQFYVQSAAAAGAGVAQRIPDWYAPGSDAAALDQRSFMMIQWLPAVALVTFLMFISRLNNAILGYGLFRVASDIEKLPFPMATIGAQGIMALAEQSEEEKDRGEESWRWRVFAIGGILGLAFGMIYMGLPTITGALLQKPIMILPIPWTDFTNKTQSFLPAVAIGINWNLNNLVYGMVLPFFAMLGSFVALIVVMIANPILYRYGILRSWNPNDDTVPTMYKNNIDFYFSFTIGVSAAIAVAGLWQIIRNVQRRRQVPGTGQVEERFKITDIARRGDIKTSVVLATYLMTTMAYILLSGYLINWNRGVMIVLFFMGFLYTPLISYVTARLEGMAGQVIQIPFVREAAFILSGYRGDVDVWFLPVPIHNYGVATVRYRQAELTGTRFWSLWKAEIVLTPIVLISTIFFANFIWSLAPIPSARYPYTEKIWELNAAMAAIIHSATLGGHSPFKEAFDGWNILAGGVFGLFLFFVMWMLRMPVLFVFGMLRGLNQTLPHVVIPQFIGALLSRFYFERKMGLKWRQYVPVVAAGFTCGMGLISMLCAGITFLAKAVIQLPY